MNETLTPSQTKIVDAVAACGPATAQRIAEVTGLGYSTVTALLRNLATAGLVQREHDLTWVAIVSQSQGHTEPSPEPADVVAEPEPTGDLDAGQAIATEPGIESEPSTGSSIEHGGETSSGTNNSHVEGTDGSIGLGDNDPGHETGDSDAADGEAGDGQADAHDEARDAPNLGAGQQSAEAPTGQPAQPPSSDAEPDHTDAVAVAVASGPRRRYNKTDKPKRGKGQLYDEVRAYFVANPDVTLTPRAIGKAIDASDGAVVNVCHKLVTAGVITEASADKVAFVHTPPTN